MSQIDSFLWVEKYRPQTIDDCILPDRVKSELRDAITQGSIGNLLMYGSAGTGKTTLARSLANELNADLLYINASNENGVETIRNKVTQFASTVSLDGNLKIILLDECLDSEEKVRVGTVDSWKSIPLREFVLGVDYDIVSVSMETGEFQNDTGRIISDREDEVFEVTLEDGRSLRCNAKHPLLVFDGENIKQKPLEEISEGDLILA